MKVKFKESRKRTLSLCLTLILLIGMTPFSYTAFADEGGAKNLGSDKVKVDSFKIIDEANAGKEIDYVTDEDTTKYNLYFSDANNFSSAVCQNQKDSRIKLQLVASYAGTERIKEGDSLTLKASYGTFSGQTFAEKTLKDSEGHTLGTYKYDKGAFKLLFSGDYIKDNAVTSFKTATLESDAVTQKSDEQGLGTNNERKVLVGSLNNRKLAVAYELKNKPNSGPSLDDVSIKSFKIIDITHGNKLIDYRKSSDVDYDTWKNNPAGFGYALNQDQQSADVMLELEFQYANPDRVLQEGDKLTIPASYGGTSLGFSEIALPLRVTDDSGKHTLGTWKYEKGAFTITFGGEYVKNHNIKKFSAKMSTGKMINFSASRKKSRILGEKYVLNGKLGKDILAVAAETRYIKSDPVANSIFYAGSSVDDATDHYVKWSYTLFNDYFLAYSPDAKRTYDYFNPYLLKNNGQYRPGSATGIYLESTYENCIAAPVIGQVYTLFSDVDDSGNITNGWYSSIFNRLLTKVDQGNKTKAQVKTDLQKGQYCMYNNHDGSYTFMMKWYDMNDPNGATYNDLPEVTDAGGVGSLLKKKYPDAFGGLSDTTVQKLNNLYNGKALQNLQIKVIARYKTVKENTAVQNTMKLTTSQTGEKSYDVHALMAPSDAGSEANNDPLAIRLIKSDRYTGEKLSDGFKFELQKSTDGGNNWNKVNLTAAMVKSGQLNTDGTITPKNGVVDVKNLTGGQKYRFVEKAHAAGYQNTKIDEAHPNSATHFTSANSRAVDVKNTGKGHVVNMYNAKLPAPAKIVIGGKKNLSGRAVKEGEFRFQLFDKITDDKVGQPVKNDSHGNFKKEMSFDKEGVYKYYFTELNDRQKGITYDISKKPVTIEVKKGNDGNMQANVISAPIMFNNKFTPDPSVPNMPNKPTNPTPTTKVVKTVRGPRTEDNTNIGLFVLLLAGASGALAATQVFKRKKR